MHASRVLGKALKLNSNLTWFLFLLFGLLFCFFLKNIEVGKEREEREGI